MRIVITTFTCIPLLCSTAWAVESNTSTTTTVSPTPTTELNTPVANANHTSTQALRTVGNNTTQVVKVVAGTATATATTVGGAINSENKPLTAEQIAKQKALNESKVKALVKEQETRLQELEKANLDALAQNQELQLKNDSLGVQIEVLQSERSAQMFIYGAATIAVGVFCGFLMASYIYTKRRRQW